MSDNIVARHPVVALPPVSVCYTPFTHTKINTILISILIRSAKDHFLFDTGYILKKKHGISKCNIEMQ